MKRRWLLVTLSLAALTLLLRGSASHAAGPTYRNTSTVHLPPVMSQLTSFDLSFVDSTTGTFVFTDRNNKSLDAFDTRDGRFLGASDPLFVGISPSGCNAGGPNGVVIISSGAANGDRGQAWSGDGNSTLKVIDLNSLTLVGLPIPTGGVCRANELWWDPEDEEIVIGNGSDMPEFLTFISTKASPGPGSVLGQLIYDGGSGCGSGTGSGVPNLTVPRCHTVKAINNMEEPEFDLHHFWVDIPGNPAAAEEPERLGHIDEIDPKTFQVLNSISLPDCVNRTLDPPVFGPQGLTVGPDHIAALACPTGVQLVNLSTRATVGSPVAGTGGADQIQWNRGDNHVYVPNSNALTPGGCANNDSAVVAARSPTPPAPSVTPAQANSCVAVIDASDPNKPSVIAEVQLPADAGSHSVAVDSQLNKVFVPVKDSTCTQTTACPPVASSITPCPVPAEAGGCVHDQGIAIIQLGP